MKIDLLQHRRWFTPTTTISDLFVNGAWEMFTLEDVRREPGMPKVPKQTAIPEGVYRVELTHSEKFNRILPLIFNVELPDGRRFIRSADGLITFSGVRYHPGNGPEDTEGCPLTGRIRQPDNLRVLQSRLAFDPFFAKLAAAGPGEISLTIKL